MLHWTLWIHNSQMGNVSRSFMQKAPGIDLYQDLVMGEPIDNHDGDLVEEIQSFQAIDTEYFNAMYTLSRQAQRNLSQAGVDAVVASTSTLLDVHTGALQEQLKKALEERNIDPVVVDGIMVQHGLSQFDTASKRQTLVERKLSYVAPKEVVLGKQFVTKKGVLTETSNHGYIIPFQESLRNLLEMPKVWHHINNPHFTDGEEFMFDICDGTYIRTHPLFSRNPLALQIVLNTDDLEIVNPLGSHVKKTQDHCFYYTLANIPPQYRSGLTAIQLLAIAKTKHVRKDGGIKKLLRDFIDTVNQLSSGGVKMDLHDTEHTIEGALVPVPADTLAAHWLGGFKEGVSFALKNCRNYEKSGNTLKTKCLDTRCSERTYEVHVERCKQLDTLSKKALLEQNVGDQ